MRATRRFVGRAHRDLLGSSESRIRAERDRVATEGWGAKLISLQDPDGRWGGGDYSPKPVFHTGIQALEALYAYQQAGGEANEEAQARGREFFLRHRLCKSHRTGEVAIRASTRFPQLPQWHFDVLRGLEHFAEVVADGDQRLDDAIAVVRHARRTDGR
ncbi:MAG TPA: hypothetical protein VI094_09980 [Propionibacteriaceae bacterium]